MNYLVTADLHLKPETADTVFAVLEEFSAQAQQRGVLTLILLGDVYDVRYTVPIELQNRFLDWVTEQEDLGLHVIILPGNHDQDDTSGRNALEVFARDARVWVMNEPAWNDAGLWLPFRKDPAELATFIQENPRPESSPNIAWLHHGIVGALMNDHVVAGEFDGLHPSVFSSFDTVFCGHWHRHQEIQNIVYVGSPWQTRADEAGQEKGFVWIDDEGWEFVPIRVGSRHHRVRVSPGGVLDVAGFAPGDKVKIVLDDEADAQRVATIAANSGVKAVIEPPKVEYGEDRLGLGEDSDAEEFARAYAREHGKDLDQGRLLDIFKRIAS